MAGALVLGVTFTLVGAIYIVALLRVLHRLSTPVASTRRLLLCEQCERIIAVNDTKIQFGLPLDR